MTDIFRYISKGLFMPKKMRVGALLLMSLSTCGHAEPLLLECDSKEVGNFGRWRIFKVEIVEKEPPEVAVRIHYSNGATHDTKFTSAQSEVPLITSRRIFLLDKKFPGLSRSSYDINRMSAAFISKDIDSDTNKTITEFQGTCVKAGEAGAKF